MFVGLNNNVEKLRMLNVIEKKNGKMAAEKNFLVLGIFFVLKI